VTEKVSPQECINFAKLEGWSASKAVEAFYLFDLNEDDFVTLEEVNKVYITPKENKAAFKNADKN